MSGPSSTPASAEDAADPQPQTESFGEFGLVDRRIDIAVCTAAFLLGLALVVLSGDIRQGSIPDPIGPDGWPKLLGTTLMIAMGVNIVRRSLSWRTSQSHMVASDGGKDDVPSEPGTFMRPAALLISALVWVLVVRWTGFIVATTGLLIAGLALMRVRKPAKLLLLPLLFSLAAWLLFGAFFGVRLPAGPVEQALIEILPGVR